MQPPRPVEELNSVVVAAIVVVGGGGGCGPQLGRAHGLLSSLQILKQNIFFFFLLLFFLLFRALQNVFGCKRFWRKRITRNWIFCDGVVTS